MTFSLGHGGPAFDDGLLAKRKGRNAHRATRHHGDVCPASLFLAVPVATGPNGATVVCSWANVQNSGNVIVNQRGVIDTPRKAESSMAAAPTITSNGGGDSAD